MQQMQTFDMLLFCLVNGVVFILWILFVLQAPQDHGRFLANHAIWRMLSFSVNKTARSCGRRALAEVA